MGVRVAHNLVSSSIVDFIELSDDYSLVELSVWPEWVDKNLQELEMRVKYGINVLAIRHGSSINVSPRSDDVIREGDVLVAIGSNQNIKRLEAHNQ